MAAFFISETQIEIGNVEPGTRVTFPSSRASYMYVKSVFAPYVPDLDMDTVWGGIYFELELEEGRTPSIHLETCCVANRRGFRVDVYD